MLASALGAAELYLAQDAPNAPNPPGGSQQPEWATLGPDAPIAWPSGAAKVPVTGQLSPHAAAALERMGITTPPKE